MDIDSSLQRISLLLPLFTAKWRDSRKLNTRAAKYFGNTLIQPRIIYNFPAHLRLAPPPTNLCRAKQARAYTGKVAVSVRLTMQTDAISNRTLR